jgi:uncharacterized delta-60 repeat protein
LKHIAFDAKFGRVLWIVAIPFLLFFSLSSTFAASNTINIQGRLVDSDGTNLSAACVGSNICDFRLTVYESIDATCNTSDTQVSQETFSNITLNNGIFNLALGTGTGSSIPTYDFDSHYTCVRILLDADGNGDFVSPEDFGVVNFQAVPYSFHSNQSAQTKGLVTATGVVDVSSSVAPTAGQVLTAVDANNATWQNPFGISVGLDTAFWDWSSPISKDSFTDTNGTLLTSHTPDIGPTWSVNLSSESEWTIQSNQLNRSGNIIRHAFMNAGQTDVMACAQFTTLENLSAILIRRQDTANYWELYFDYGNQGWQFNKVVAGVDIPIGPTLQGTTGTVCLSANGDVVTARSPHGDTYSVTDTDLNTQTGVGMILDGFGGIPSVVDNWIVVGVNEESVTNLSNIFLNNGNSFGIGAVLGTNDNNSLSFETNNTIRALFDTNGHFTPFLDDTYDLGSNSNRWRDLYLGGTTLHIGTSTTDEGTLSYDTTNNVLNISTDSTTNGDIAFNTNQLFIDKSTGNVGLGLLNPTAKLSVLGSVLGGGSQIENLGSNSFTFGNVVSGNIDESFSVKGGIGSTLAGSSGGIAVQSDGKIIVVGSDSFNDTPLYGNLARFNSNGTIDSTYDVGVSPVSEIRGTTLQTDNKLLVFGSFTSFNDSTHNRLLRLNVNGTVDSTFNIGSGFNNVVDSVSVQSDGKIIVGGWFTEFNGNVRNRIVRLNTDGSIDNTFNIGSGFDSLVYATEIQSDGRILVGGAFSSYNATSKNRITRLNSDGSVDNTFNIGTGMAGSYVMDIGIDSNNKVIATGYFFSYNGVNRNSLVRINSDGSIDNTFNPGTGAAVTSSLIVLSDNKVIIGGDFTTYGGNVRNRIVRLNTDGTLDNTFSVGTGFNGRVNHMTIHQSTGDIFVDGVFTSYNNVSANRLARLTSDGTLSGFFNTGNGFSAGLLDFVVQSDGKLVIGGFFTTYDNIPVNYLARLNTDGSVDSSYNMGTGPNATVRKHVNSIRWESIDIWRFYFI